MKFQIEKITPAIAQQLLDSQGTNRKITPVNIKRYSNAMQNGNWDENGETIKIDKNGKLIDGQHRMLSIINSGIPQNMLVVRNLNPDVFVSIDSGKSRSTGDVLGMAGISNSSAISALAKKLLLWQKNKKSFPSDRNSLVNHSLTTTSVLKYATENDLTNDVLIGKKFYNRFKALNNGEYSFIYHIFSAINQNDADEFFKIFTEGFSVSQFNPAFVLRNKFIKNSNHKMTQNQKFILIVRAWNLFREGLECQLIKETSATEVPKIK